MASAIGEGWNVVWSESKQKGTAIWLGKVPGQPPLRFDPLPEGRKRRCFTKEEKRAVVDYAVEVRKSKSIGTCAKEIGITPILSEWVRAECATYRAFSSLDLDNRTLWVVDYRELLASLREGKTSICVSDYTEVGKSSGRLPISEGAGGPGLAIGEGRGVVQPVSDRGGTAVWMCKGPGEPPLWFEPRSKGSRQKDYTEKEKRAIVDYALEVRETKSMGTCAKEMGIKPTSLSNWVKWGCEAYRIFSCLQLDSRTLRAIDYRKLLADLRSGMESITISDYTGGVKFSTRKRTPGTRLEGVPAQEEIRGGHPYFLSPGKGKRRVFTEEQKARVVDYLIDRFDGESFSECARECNLCKKTLIKWADERDSKRACADTKELPENSPETTGSDPVEDPLPDIAKRKRYAKGRGGTAQWLSNRLPGTGPMGVQAKEYARDGYPYFASEDEGEGCVFAEEQRERVASYRSHGLMEESVSGDFRACNLDEQTLSDVFDDTYGCTSKRFCPDATQLSESAPETTGFDPDEDLFFDMSWQLCLTGTLTGSPSSEFFFEK
ncbi:MAG: hypothetical protein OXF02_06595 [Simkaniaceae bacterium]|nr:hypothetical protein [Simkaniaceae bacterium]